MFFIIALVLVFFSSIAFLVNQFRMQTIFHCKLFDRTYYWPNHIVEAAVDSIGYERGEYQIICQLTHNQKKVTLPATERLVQKLNADEKIYLIQYQFPKGYAYTYAPLTKFEGKFNISTNNDSEDTSLISEFSEKTKKLHTLNLILYIIAILSIKAFVTTSIFLSVTSIVLFLNVIPCKRWTNNLKIGIIKSADKENNSLQKKTDNSTNLPDGYSDWSDNKKELFAIQQKIYAEIQNQNAPQDKAEDFETKLPETTTENIPSAAEPKADPVSETPHCCKACGCIVSSTAQFCEHCGAPLNEEAAEDPEEPEDKDVEDSDTENDAPESKKAKLPSMQESPDDGDEYRKSDSDAEDEDDDDFSSMVTDLGCLF